MTDPIDSLARLTPTSAGSRDALLFEAGRASVSRRGWKAACAILACSQALTLVLLWPRTEPDGVVPPPTPSSPATEGGAVRPEVPMRVSPLDFFQISARGERGSLSGDEPIPSSLMVLSGPTLTAGSRIPPN